jgi:hypothetical protein
VNKVGERIRGIDGGFDAGGGRGASSRFYAVDTLSGKLCRIYCGREKEEICSEILMRALNGGIVARNLVYRMSGRYYSFRRCKKRRRIA